MVGRGGGGPWSGRGRGVLLKQLCSGRSGPVPYTEGIWGGDPLPGPFPRLRSRLEVKDGRSVQAELLWAKRDRRRSKQRSKTRNPYLTTDASMAANVEDKPDKRPLRSRKDEEKQKHGRTGCISSRKFRAGKILGATLTGYFSVVYKKSLLLKKPDN